MPSPQDTSERPPAAPSDVLSDLQAKYEDFTELLAKNHEVLKTIADMEEKAQGEYLLDVNYIRERLRIIRLGVREIIDRLVALGGQRYAVLRQRFSQIDREIAALFPGSRGIRKDAFTVTLHGLSLNRGFSVGNKSARLAEMQALGLPVPDGFAITAWAYKHFLDANDLQARISRRLDSVDIRSYEKLVEVGREIQEMVASSALPDDLADALRRAQDDLSRRSGAKRFALRSSAIGEDTQFSFAGQYDTYLNISGGDLVHHYRRVVASKFSPKAIYYFLSHDMTEEALAMGVCCLVMIDPAASGVTYSLDPVAPQRNSMLISAVYGLGKYLVDGTTTPDVFRASRADGSVIEQDVAVKPVRLVLDESGGTVEVPVEGSKQQQPAVTPDQLRVLVRHALTIERHYGTPQDIEWAIDRSGQVFVLQARPLRVVATQADAPEPELEGATALMSDGMTICPGAGAGEVYHARSRDALAGVPAGCVLIAPNPFPGLITVLDKIDALVVESGGIASHLATIAREYRTPTLGGMAGAMRLEAGRSVTVDATGATIYDGVLSDLVEARRPENDLFEDTAIFQLLEQVLNKVAPLNLVDPKSRDFKPENCQTFHDITRLAHQRAMEAMFSAGRSAESETIGRLLKTTIPLPVRILHLDKPEPTRRRDRTIAESDLHSAPMQALWSGVLAEGWPETPRGFGERPAEPMATSRTRGDSKGEPEMSFAILSADYMSLNLRLGYHFTSVTALACPEQSKNYIRLQYKEGGATFERRARRIRLISDILAVMGFECMSEGDFLDASVTYEPADTICEKLHRVGRILMMTKQLDMALSSDALTEWYTKDFLSTLGLPYEGERTA